MHLFTLGLKVIVIFSGQERLQQLLIFALAADAIPLFWVNPKPKKRLKHPVDTPNNPRNQFPYADTCTNELCIPVVHPYALFKGNMNSAMNSLTLFTDA